MLGAPILGGLTPRVPTFVYMLHPAWLRSLIVLGSLLGISHGHAQREVDVLRGVWEQRRAQLGPAPDTLFVRLTNELSVAYQYDGSADSALSLAHMAMRMAEEGVRLRPAAERRTWQGLLMAAQRTEAAQLFFLNRYPESIAAIKRYLGTAEELQLPEEIGAAYNYLGYCHTAMDDLPGALQWSRKAMETMRGVGPGPDLANAYTGLGNILDEMGQRDSALVYLRKALDLHRTMDHPNNHASTLFSAIETLRRMGQEDSVDAYLVRAKGLVDRLDEPRPTMNYLSLLGQRELDQGRLKEALAHLLQADSMALRLEDHRARHYIDRSLALAYAGVGDARQAWQRAEVADAEMKSDLGLEKVRAVAAAQAQAEQEKLLATAEAKAEALRKGRWFAWALAGGGVLVALLLGILYQQGRKSARRLAAAQDELMRLEKQREAERVRMNVSRDIHDELGGSLSKIALLSDLLQGGGSADEHVARLRSIAEHARRVRGGLNDVVWAADPSSDTAGALLQHIADRAHQLLEGTGVALQLDLHADEPGRTLSPAFKRDLSMVVKEALNNALKHARPTIIMVRLSLCGSRYELSVTDNGQGLRHGPVDGGNGLVNMRTRIGAHGGTLEVRSGENNVGTVVGAQGPIVSP